MLTRLIYDLRGLCFLLRCRDRAKQCFSLCFSFCFVFRCVFVGFGGPGGGFGGFPVGSKSSGNATTSIITKTARKNTKTTRQMSSCIKYYPRLYFWRIPLIQCRDYSIFEPNIRLYEKRSTLGSNSQVWNPPPRSKHEDIHVVLATGRNRALFRKIHVDKS